MKSMITKVIFFAALSATSLWADTGKTITYKNQRGSILSLTWHESSQNNADAASEQEIKTGSLTGTFTSAVGKCATGYAAPVTGVFNGNAIAITLNLPKCKQVIAMTGNLTNENEELHTLWLDAAQAADPRKDDWNSNIIGADHYKKQG